MHRYVPFALIVAAAILTLLAAALWSPYWLWLLALLVPLVVLGAWDMGQKQHTLLRLYPVSAHVRWFFEWLRPFLREYLFDSDHEGRPFTHNQRALVYRRAKDVESAEAFGTEMDLHSPRYEWINHSIQARHLGDTYRVRVGGDECKQPYDASVLNISAMSFGSLSARAVEALNLGAKMGGFYQDTGEGGISPYHLKHGGDLVWEIGTAYFGCRTEDGRFDPHKFADKAADERVKMVEIKLSQGAKPGHGGLLPGAKVTPEIAEVRGVPVGKDVLSPPSHSAFDTPVGSAGIRGATARPERRKACRLQAVHRPPLGVPCNHEGDAGDRHHPGFHRDRRCGGWHRRGAGGALRPCRNAAARGPCLRGELPAGHRPARQGEGGGVRQDLRRPHAGREPGAGSGLVQRGPGLHVLGRLRADQEVPYRPMPHRRRHPEQAAPERPRRRPTRGRAPISSIATR